MNLSFWDIMSRYRKNRRRMHEYQTIDEEPIRETSRVPRITIIAVGVTVSLAVAFVLLSQATSPETSKVEAKSTTALWHKLKENWEPPLLNTAELTRLSRRFDIERLWRVMRPILVPRVPGTPAIRQVAQHIVVTLQTLGYFVQTDRFIDKVPAPFGDTEFTNIVATWNSQAKRKLVLACHYDSKVTPKGFIGATDSACPCAMIIEIATILKPFLENQIQSDLTLQLIFFDGEEAFVKWTNKDSLYGSRHLADVWHSRSLGQGLTHLDKIDLLVLLDLIGTPDTTFRNFQFSPTVWYERAAAVEQRMSRHRLLQTSHTRFPLRRIHESYKVEDDHIPFLEKGVPVLHLISVPFPQEWHKMTDNESILHNATISDITKVVAGTAAQYLKLSITS